MCFDPYFILSVPYSAVPNNESEGIDYSLICQIKNNFFSLSLKTNILNRQYLYNNINYPNFLRTSIIHDRFLNTYI